MTEVTQSPAAELCTSFLPSQNGGAYRRSHETLIIGPDDLCNTISDAAQMIVEPAPCGVALIEQATVFGEGLICKTMQERIVAVAETLRQAVTPRSILPMQRTPEGGLLVDPSIRRRRLPPKETYAYLRQVCDNNYGHWIIEALPKLGILAEHFDLQSLKFIVTRHRITRQAYPMRKIYFDSLAAFGVAPHQIVELGREAVAVDRLLYPLPLTLHPWIKAPRAIEILEELRDRIVDGSPGPRRLFVSRAHAKKRRLVNEAEILSVLADCGVTIVYPEKLSFVEQVRLFANAELIIGNCGANLANAVFAPRGVTIFAATSEMMGDDFFWDLACLKGGKYFSLHGRAVTTPPTMNSDFTLEASVFRRLLEDRVLAAG